MLKALAICLLLTPCFLFSQDRDCPELEVLGPQWMMTAKEPATFVLRSGQDFPEVFRYIWSVENGSITSGQGTRVVEVTTLEYGTNVRVTVTVTGLPSGCPNSASEIIAVEPAPHIGVIDEWGELRNDDQRGRLDVFFAELANYPAHNGVIIIYSKTNSIGRRRLKLYVDHARFRKFDRSRLFFCLMEGPENSTKLYRLPPIDLDAPEPGCKLISRTALK